MNYDEHQEPQIPTNPDDIIPPALTVFAFRYAADVLAKVAADIERDQQQTTELPAHPTEPKDPTRII